MENIYILNNDDPHNSYKIHSERPSNQQRQDNDLIRGIVPTPAIDFVCYTDFDVELSFDGYLYVNRELNKGSRNFDLIKSLRDIKFTKISGFYNACTALTVDGHVYICGSNDQNQFGNDSSDQKIVSFKKNQSSSLFKDVSCANHTLAISNDNNIFMCGSNSHNQLIRYGITSI